MKQSCSGLALSALLTTLAGCGGATEESGEDHAAPAAFAEALQRIRAHADSVDDLFQPLPLLRPSEEAALRRYGNDVQLAVARRLGIEPGPSMAEIEQLVAQGRLVRLQDSTAHWVVRRLEHSTPYVTPDTEAQLRELGGRFQAALREIGAPPYRLEVTSVLRSAEDQERLRRVNPNAAAGQTTHAFGTTFDIAYSAFAAPVQSDISLSLPEEPWLAAHLEWTAGMLAERTAARRSRELMAMLGKVLLEMQNEGALLVTLERLQPVYHMTIARRVD